MGRQSATQRTESQTPDEQLQRFFRPKLIICSLIFVVLLVAFPQMALFLVDLAFYS